MSRSYKKNQYRKSRRFDYTCRCHGGCPYCYNNRMYNTRKRKQIADDDLIDYYMYEPQYIEERIIGAREKVTTNQKPTVTKNSIL